MIYKDRRYRTVCIVTLIAGAACLARMMQLQNACDAEGLLIRGNIYTPFIFLLLAAAGAAVFLLTRQLKPRAKGYEGLFITPAGMVLNIAGGVCTGLFAIFSLAGASTITELMTAHGTTTLTDTVLSLFGIASAVCILLSLYRMAYMKQPHLLLYTVPFLFITVYLLVEFRNKWNQDPLLLDYCFRLLSLVCAMCASYHAIGFCFDRGHRRRTCFWCLCTYAASLVCLPGAAAEQLLLHTGLGCWALSMAVPLMTDDIPVYIVPPEDEKAAAKPAKPEYETATDEESAADDDDI